MFSKVIITTVSLLTVLAAAAPTPDGVSQCNTGNTSCCNTVQAANSSPVNELLGLLGIVLGPITGSIGLGCTPITLVGVGSGANCAQQPVCCQSNTFGGIIGIGCNAISL